MSAPVVSGEARRFRRAGLLERTARVVSGRAGNGALGRALRRAYGAALWMATGGRGLRAQLPGGEIVRLTPACRGLSWNAEEYAAFRSAVREGDVVIEAGANAGAYTVLFAQWVGPAGHVYAFEPVPAIARLLAAQLRLNGVAGRVSIVPAAAGAAAGAQSFVAPGPLGINRIAASREERIRGIDVPVTSIDELCSRDRIAPGVIKIDVEGSELDVLRGARQTIASAKNLRLFAEWHPTLWPIYGVSADEVRSELAAQGLEAEPLRAGDDVWRVEGICARLIRRA